MKSELQFLQTKMNVLEFSYLIRNVAGIPLFYCLFPGWRTNHKRYWHDKECNGVIKIDRLFIFNDIYL